MQTSKRLLSFAPMPLTFPSHAAAILPVLHLPGLRRLPPVALIIGSTAPDLIYLVKVHGAAAHLPSGLLRLCLPAGLLAFLYVEALLLPVFGPLLSSVLPKSLAGLGAALGRPRGLPKTLPDWFFIAAAIVLGAATHQLWDGFTHAWMWPARVLYPGVNISLLGHPFLLSKVLQQLSSLVGAAIVILYVLRMAPPATPAAPQRVFGAARRLGGLLALPLLGALLAGFLRWRQPSPLLAKRIWDTGWTAAACFGILLGVVCLVARLASRLRKPATQTPA